MAGNVTKKYTVGLNLDVKTADAQVKKLATNINNMWADMGSAGNKFAVLKDLADYLDQIDKKIAGLKGKDLDLFNKIFGAEGVNIDKALKQAMEPILKSPELIADAMNDVQTRLAAVQTDPKAKGTAASLREVGKSINEMYKLIGQAPPIDIEKQLTGGGKIKEKLAMLTKHFEAFEVKWKDVMTTAGSEGAQRTVEGIQAELDKLEQQMNRLGEIQKKISNVNKNMQKYNAEGSIFSPQTKFTIEDVTTAIQELDTATKNFKNFKGDKSSLEYFAMLSDYIEQTIKVSSMYLSIGASGVNKDLYAQLKTTILDGKTESLADIIAHTNGQMESNSFKAHVKSFSEYSNSIDGQIETIDYQMTTLEDELERLGSAAENAGAGVLKVGEHAVKTAEYIRGMTIAIKEMFDVLSQTSDIGYKALIDGQGIAVKPGQYKEISAKTTAETFLANLMRDTDVEVHSHQGLSSSINVPNFRQAMKHQYEGLTKISAVIGKNDIVTLDLAKVKAEDAAIALEKLKEVTRGDNLKEISVEKFNKIFTDINPEYTNIAQRWNPSQFGDLAQKIFDVKQNTQQALAPVERLKNLLVALANKSIDFSNYEDLLKTLSADNVGDIFNQIAQAEGIKEDGRILQVEDISVGTVQDIAADIQRQKESFIELRQTAGVTYSEIAKAAKEYSETYHTAQGQNNEFFKKYFHASEIEEIQKKFMDLGDGFRDLNGITRELAVDFGIDPEDIESFERTENAAQQAAVKLKELDEIGESIDSLYYGHEMTDVRIGKYTEQLDAAEKAIKSLGEQEVLTAQQIEHANEVIANSRKILQMATNDNEDARKEAEGKYDYTYEPELAVAEAENKTLRAENNDLRQQLADGKAKQAAVEQNGEVTTQSEADLNHEVAETAQVQEQLETERQITAEKQKQSDIVYHAGDLSKIDKTAKSFPLGHVIPSASDVIFNGATGLYTTEDVRQFIGNEWDGAPVSSIDLSQYKMFDARVGELAAKANEFFTNLNGVIYGYLMDFSGEEVAKITNTMSVEDLYAQFQEVFKGINMDFETFKNFVEKSQAIVEGHDFAEFKQPAIDQGIAKAGVAHKLQGVSEEIFNSDSFQTQLMKMLGFEGIDLRGTKFNGTYSGGTVVFDIKPESLTAVNERMSDVITREIPKEEFEITPDYLEREEKRRQLAFETADANSKQAEGATVAVREETAAHQANTEAIQRETEAKRELAATTGADYSEDDRMVIEQAEARAKAAEQVVQQVSARVKAAEQASKEAGLQRDQKGFVVDKAKETLRGKQAKLEMAEQAKTQAENRQQYVERIKAEIEEAQQAAEQAKAEAEEAQRAAGQAKANAEIWENNIREAEAAKRDAEKNLGQTKATSEVKAKRAEKAKENIQTAQDAVVALDTEFQRYVNQLEIDGKIDLTEMINYEDYQAVLKSIHDGTHTTVEACISEFEKLSAQHDILPQHQELTEKEKKISQKQTKKINEKKTDFQIATLEDFSNVVKRNQFAKTQNRLRHSDSLQQEIDDTSRSMEEFQKQYGKIIVTMRDGLKQESETMSDQIREFLSKVLYDKAEIQDIEFISTAELQAEAEKIKERRKARGSEMAQIPDSEREAKMIEAAQTRATESPVVKNAVKIAEEKIKDANRAAEEIQIAEMALRAAEDKLAEQQAVSPSNMARRAEEATRAAAAQKWMAEQKASLIGNDSSDSDVAEKSKAVEAARLEVENAEKELAQAQKDLETAEQTYQKAQETVRVEKDDLVKAQRDKEEAYGVLFDAEKQTKSAPAEPAQFDHAESIEQEAQAHRDNAIAIEAETAATQDLVNVQNQAEDSSNVEEVSESLPEPEKVFDTESGQLAMFEGMSESAQKAKDDVSQLNEEVKAIEGQIGIDEIQEELSPVQEQPEPQNVEVSTESINRLAESAEKAKANVVELSNAVEEVDKADDTPAESTPVENISEELSESAGVDQLTGNVNEATDALIRMGDEAKTVDAQIENLGDQSTQPLVEVPETKEEPPIQVNEVEKVNDALKEQENIVQGIADAQTPVVNDVPVIEAENQGLKEQKTLTEDIANVPQPPVEEPKKKTRKKKIKEEPKKDDTPQEHKENAQAIEAEAAATDKLADATKRANAEKKKAEDVKTSSRKKATVSDEEREERKARKATIDSTEKKLRGKFNTLDFKVDTQNLTDEQQKLADEYKKLNDILEQYGRDASKVSQQELADTLQRVNALQQEIDAYKTKYNIVDGRGGTKNAYGKTAVVNARAKYNSIEGRAQAYAGSTVVDPKLKEYKASLEELIKLQAQYKSGQELTPEQETQFIELKNKCNDYYRSLKKVIDASDELKNNGSEVMPIMDDIALDEFPDRAQALKNYVNEIHGSRAAIGKLNGDATKLAFTIKNGDGTITKMTASLNAARTAIVSTAGDTEKATTKLGQFFSGVWSKFGDLWTYATARFGVDEVIQQVRQGIQYVRDIDSALTELKKVTDETDASYDKFLQTMSKSAKVVGSTVADLTNSAADWARLNI